MGGRESDEVKLVEAPILFLVLSHKAVDIELAEIHRIAVDASDINEVVAQLSRRLQFLKLVYKYHCAAEDEVLFRALDAQVKNVVFSYSLEHNSIDDLFSSMFDCLDRLQTEKEEVPKLFNELTCSIGTIQTTISQHMLKEEEQIFPLMMEKFSAKEQARLVWQYLCSVPLMILEDFMPWLTTTLSSDEKAGFLSFIYIVLPEDKLIQEVFISWLDDNMESTSQSCKKYGKGTKFHYGAANLKCIFELDLQCREKQQLKAAEEHNPIDGFHIWHAAIMRDLKVIMEQLYQLRSSICVSTLSSVITQLKFFTDVFTFYSNAVDQIFYPLVDELTKDEPSSIHEKFIERIEIEELQKLLYSKLHEGIQLRVFIDILCQEVESFVGRINKKQQFLETEVYVIIREICSHELQLWLLEMSLQMLPLGLLKCMIIWFSAHLSEPESRLTLEEIKLGSPLVNKSFANLLYEWVRIGYSGKISVGKFRKDLEEMFSSRSYLFEKWSKSSGCSSSNSELQSSDRSISATASNNTLSNIEKHDTPYSNGINLQIFFSESLKNVCFLPETAAGMGYSSLDVTPIDFIYFFHKALKKDLQYVLSLSVKLSEDARVLAEFERRFHRVRFLYQLHSKSEDDVAFPALESKGQLQNVSHSYGIDHKLEVEQFDKIYVILNEITRLLQDDLDVAVSKKPKYKKLCLNLHDTCIAMHKTLTGHIYCEEVELWPLFKEHFSIEEQEKIIGELLGRTKAENLQEMIPWLMESLTPEEQHCIMSIWRKATKHTKFFEWLGEWWEGVKMDEIVNTERESKVSPSLVIDPLEVVSAYLSRDDLRDQKVCHGKGENFSLTDQFAGHDKPQNAKGDKNVDRPEDITRNSSEVDKKKGNDAKDLTDRTETTFQDTKTHKEHRLILTQEELVALIRRVSSDSSLDAKEKSNLMQSLLMSQWILTQKKSDSEDTATKDKEKILGRCPSFRDETESVFGCRHYKRNCKLLAPCCNKLFTCIRCHDEITDHSLDRKCITHMMCMKCLRIQPICPHCSTLSCNSFSMAAYYCRICKIFEDKRQFYHCPFCNLCRLGKESGIGYFHCMTCNACMSTKHLSVHTCRENCLDDNCPICHEYLSTSTNPLKQLPCGHLMHSSCFQDHTQTHYTCPVCSKTLGDMKMYFEMLDAYLAVEKIPEEYAGQIQVILCNDCSNTGTASFHWIYHKCPHCGSYNTRLI